MTGDMAPWNAGHARRVLERIGRAQLRARHAAARHAEAQRCADEAENASDRDVHEREAAQHLSAMYRHEEAVDIQTQHLRHMFLTEQAFRQWLDAHDPAEGTDDLGPTPPI